jgi:hypothetical protein
MQLNQVKPEIARLSVTLSDIRIISIDGKSISDNTINLYPGEQKVTLYIGINNYVFEINYMVIIAAKFKANNDYFLKSNLGKTWIESAEVKFS